MAFPVPKIDTPWERAALELLHPDFEADAGTLEFYRHSHKMTGGFAQDVRDFSTEGPAAIDGSTYLIPNEKENPEGLSFIRRASRASPADFCRKGIAHTMGALMQTPPDRSAYPDQIKDFLDNVTPKGATFDLFLARELGPLMIRYAYVFLLPHRNRIAGETQGQSDALGQRMFLSLVTPEALQMWEERDDGTFEWVRYVEPYQLPVSPEGTETEEIKRHWYLTREGYWAVDYIEGDESGDKTKVVESGYWLGQNVLLEHFPLVEWSLEDRLGPMNAGAPAQLEYVRTESEMIHLEGSCAFPQTWVPEGGGSDDKNPPPVKGHDIIGTFDDQSKHKPMILSPDSGPFDHFRERLPQIADKALEPFGLQYSIKAGASGVALAHDQSTRVNLMRNFAKALAVGEFETMRAVSEQMRIEFPEEARSTWPDEFGTLSTTIQMENLETTKALGPIGKPLEKRIIMKAVDVNFPGLSEEEKKEIEEGIEEAQNEAAAMALALQVSPEDDEGEEGPAPPQAAGGSKPAVLDPKRASGGREGDGQGA